MIQLEKICKSFHGKPVLQNLSWTVKAGETWEITGASGCGKTTLLHIIMGIQPVDSGQVNKVQAVKFCPVFQEDRLVDGWNALQNVILVCDNEEKSLQILCELLPVAALSQPVSTLSGGMRRRVALARALAASGDMLILDEPFAGLDQKTIEQTAKVLCKYREDRAVLLVSHGTGYLFPEWKKLTL